MEQRRGRNADLQSNRFTRIVQIVGYIYRNFAMMINTDKLQAQYFKKKRVVDYERDQKMQKMAGQTMVRPQGQQQQQDKPFWKIW